MFPSTIRDANKFCCDPSTCPEKNNEHEAPPPTIPSTDEINMKNVWNKMNQEMQISATKISSSEKINHPDSEYKIMHQDKDRSAAGENSLECQKTLRENLAKRQGYQKHLLKNKKNAATKYKVNFLPDTVYLKIPLEIHLKVFCNFSPCSCTKNGSSVSEEQHWSHSCSTPTNNINIFENGFMPQCCCCITKAQEMCIASQHSKSTQTDCVAQFEAGYMPPCWSTLQKTKEFDCCYTNKCESESEKLDSIENVDKAHSLPAVCNCGREKITKEEYEELKQPKSNAKLFNLICENKLKCACDLKATTTGTPAQLTEKVYRLALPQHKDLDVCIGCGYDPSPLIDENGRIFCPGNCGCCLCPWKPRATPSLEDVFRHTKIKVCKCRNRTTVFNNNLSINDSHCSQVSHFDVCPCQEKAEAKYLELYGYEMWDKNKNLRQKLQGKEVLLKDVKPKIDQENKNKKFSASILFKDN